MASIAVRSSDSAAHDRSPRRWRRTAAVLLATGLVCLASSQARAQVTTRVSVTSAGAQVLDQGSSTSDISGDGRYVTFASRSALLVVQDTNGASDVFVHDRVTGITSRVSVSSTGAQALGGSVDPAISANGRFVAFASDAQNLVSGDTNATTDVFLHDRDTGATSRVSVGPGGIEATAASQSPSISGDGNVVAFSSAAPNLVPADTNGVADVFVHDRRTGITSRVSVRSSGVQSITGEARSPALNTDGRFVAFSSTARDLIPGDTNGVEDVFVHDRSTGLTERVSVSSSGGEGYSASSQPAIDGSGRQVVFASRASTLVPADRNAEQDVFLHDRDTGVTSRVNVGPADVESRSGPIGGLSGMVDISADGRVVAFYSYAVNLTGENLPGIPHVYVRDLAGRVTARLDVRFGGPTSPCCGTSFSPALSDTGRFVAFDSSATDLVQGDTNDQHDVFVRDIDADADGLLESWETLFGLNGLEGTGADGPGGDPDGDGQTNLDEYGDGTHPRGFYRRYLPEGANSPRFFITQIALMNVQGVNPVVLRFDTGTGSTSSTSLQLAGLQRATIRTVDRPELGDTAFSTVIESTHPLVIDRQVTWSERMYGAHVETALAAPSTTWYLAEGATHSHFSLFYLMQNPNDIAVDVTVTYLRGVGAPLTKTYRVAARSRFNIWVNEEARTDPALADLRATDVSARFVATAPVLVERAMYLDHAGNDGTFGTGDDILFNAGHESAAVPAPALSWFLAEGATGPYFDEFILVANPGEADAAVQVQYLLGDGQVLTKAYDVRAASRFNIWVNEETFPGQGKALADTAVSAIVTSTNGVPIIVERSMWWPRPSPTWMEAHNSPGTTATGTKWGLAEGEAGGPSATETYILIANTSSFAGTARVTLVVEGAAPYVVDVPLPANSRTNVPVIEAWFPGITGKRFGALIESLGPTPAQIVVERAMYSDAEGVHWAAGSNAVATRLAP